MKLKTLFIVVGIFLVGTSCGKEKQPVEPGIIGEWKLTEELIDPGNGSGTFQPVTSNKIIIFSGDGTFNANGEMCSMTNQASTNHQGTYDPATETFSPYNCMSMQAMAYHYSLNGNTLILTYPCIEGCQQKYSRI